MDAIETDPDFYNGFLTVIVISLIWSTAFFLLNHPKLTLIGTVPAFLCGLIIVLAAGDSPASLGSGAILYMIATVALIVMAFATKKICKAAPAQPVVEQI